MITVTIMSVLSNVRVWILAAIICGFALGPLGEWSSYALIVALIVMMTLSLDGLEFHAKDFRENKKGIALGVLFCFGVAVVITMLLGLPFYNSYHEVWLGWVLLASIPCAVSVVTSTFLLKGNTKLSVLTLTVIYLASLVITPVLAMIFFDGLLSPLMILKYVLLFVALPIILSIPVKKLNLPKIARTMLINISFFVLVGIAFASNRNFFFTEPWLVLSIIILILIRLIILTFIPDFIMKKKDIPRENRMVYVFMSFWKNTGMGTAMAGILFVDSPLVALPCAIAVVIDMIWFIFILSYYEDKTVKSIA